MKENEVVRAKALSPIGSEMTGIVHVRPFVKNCAKGVFLAVHESGVGPLEPWMEGWLQGSTTEKSEIERQVFPKIGGMFRYEAAKDEIAAAIQKILDAGGQDEEG